MHANNTNYVGAGDAHEDDLASQYYFCYGDSGNLMLVVIAFGEQDAKRQARNLMSHSSERSEDFKAGGCYVTTQAPDVRATSHLDNDHKDAYSDLCATARRLFRSLHPEASTQEIEDHMRQTRQSLLDIVGNWSA